MKSKELLNCSANWSSDLNEGIQAMPLSVAQLQQVSPTALAYLGDAVYELYVRNHYVLPPKRSQTYHRLVVAQVRAEAQALHLQSLTHI